MKWNGKLFRKNKQYQSYEWNANIHYSEGCWDKLICKLKRLNVLGKFG